MGNSGPDTGVSWGAVDGWFTSEEANKLREAVKAAPDGAIVEVGVYLGRSARVLDEERGRRELWLYDDCSLVPEEIRELQQDELRIAFTKDWPIGSDVKWCMMDPVADPYFPQRVALLHQDADHTYEVLLGHLEALGPHVLPGGFIVLHDYWNCTYPDVKRAWRDWKDSEQFERWGDGVDTLQVFKRKE